MSYWHAVQLAVNTSSHILHNIHAGVHTNKHVFTRHIMEGSALLHPYSLSSIKLYLWSVTYNQSYMEIMQKILQCYVMNCIRIADDNMLKMPCYTTHSVRFLIIWYVANFNYKTVVASMQIQSTPACSRAWSRSWQCLQFSGNEGVNW